MDNVSMGAMEERFAQLIWANEPIGSGELCRLALGELGWKKSTTYTVLKRLCDRGIFQNLQGTVSSRMSREELRTAQSRQFVDSAFAGSLPAFLAAFTGRKKLSEADVRELEALIRRYREE